MAFENFPYTNFHELNINWILAKVKENFEKNEVQDGEISSLGDALDTLTSRVDDITSGLVAELRIITSDYESFDAVVDAYNSGDYGWIVVNSDITLSSAKTISKPVTIIGQDKGLLTLNADLTVMKDTTVIALNSYANSGTINVDGSDVKIIGSRLIGRYDYDGNLITISRGIGLEIIATHFESDALDSNNLTLNGIGYAQTTTNAHQNSDVAECYFRLLNNAVVVTLEDAEQWNYYAGVRYLSNTIISCNYAFHCACCDHIKILSNIIDYCVRPIDFNMANGLTIADNYIYSSHANVTNVNINASRIAEKLTVENNYVWNANSGRVGTTGIAISGNNIGAIVKNNYVRFCNRAFNLSGVFTALVLNENVADYCVYSGGFTNDSTVSRSYSGKNIATPNTANGFENLTKASMEMFGLYREGSFNMTVQPNSYNDEVITHNLGVVPRVFVSKINNTSTSSFHVTIMNPNNTTFTVRVYNTSSGNAVQLQYNWLAIRSS